MYHKTWLLFKIINMMVMLSVNLVIIYEIFDLKVRRLNAFSNFGNLF